MDQLALVDPIGNALVDDQNRMVVLGVPPQPVQPTSVASANVAIIELIGKSANSSIIER